MARGPDREKKAKRGEDALLFLILLLLSVTLLAFALVLSLKA